MTRSRAKPPLDRALIEYETRRPDLPDPGTPAAMEPGKLDEGELLFAYRHSTAPQPLERPVAPVIDESGLVYGEPVSRGRTARWRILGNGD